MARAPLARRDAEALAEQAGEIARIEEAGAIGDIGDREAARARIDQQVARAIQPHRVQFQPGGTTESVCDARRWQPCGATRCEL